MSTSSMLQGANSYHNITPKNSESFSAKTTSWFLAPANITYNFPYPTTHSVPYTKNIYILVTL